MKNILIFFSILVVMGLLVGCHEDKNTDKAEVDKVLDDNMNTTDLADIQSKTVKYLEDKGLIIVSSKGLVESYVLGSDVLKGPNYGIVWGVQHISVDDYIGKTIDTYNYVVKNHKLDSMGDKNETILGLLVCEGEIIGGFSFPSSSVQEYGGVYSIDGETLEEVTGQDFQTWRKEWEAEYDGVDEQGKLDIYQLKMDLHHDLGSEIIKIVGYGNYESTLTLFDADNNILFETKRGELFGDVKAVETFDFNGDNLKDILVTTDMGGTWGAYGYYLYAYNEGEFRSINIDEFMASNQFLIELEPNSVTFIYHDSGDRELIEFSDETKATLLSLDKTNPTNYEWGPRVFSHYYSNGSELVMVARSQLVVEHKLLVVAEAIVEYGFRDNQWVPIDWDIKDKQT